MTEQPELIKPTKPGKEHTTCLCERCITNYEQERKEFWKAMVLAVVQSGQEVPVNIGDDADWAVKAFDQRFAPKEEQEQ